MAQTPYRTRVATRSPVPGRPGQDMVTVRKQAGQFPSIGMTLRNYQYDPRDRHKRRGQTVVLKPRWWQKIFGGITLKRAVITLVILVMLVGGFVAGKFIYNAHKLFGGSIFGVLTTTKLKGEDTGRVNILLAGNSSDDPGHSGANLTDSIMVVSIDTVHHKAFLLSVPRDLWVKVDGSGHQKINEAYVTGQDNDFSGDGYPKGGMGQLEQVVSQDLGIDINYYALIDYKALEDAVNAVGGIDITVKSDDPRGLYDPNIDYANGGPLVRLSNGTHHLNGRQALDLARARGDSYNSYGFAGSDFDRTEHQRQMLVALKSKAVSAGVITNPDKLTKLSDAIGNNVKTDFKLPEVHRLYDLTKDIGGGSIKSLSLNDDHGKNLLRSYSAPGGQSALIPAAGIDNFYEIQSFINRQVSSNPVVQEAANVVVLNGTTADGLAGKVKKKLAAKNVIVSQVGDASGPHPTTTIIDISESKKPSTRSLLLKMFGNHVVTTNPYAGLYDADFIVVIGNDQVPTSTSQ
jgi:polyisoprenyl-teichoic acid--peptidoglycan teichoic acid transferase